ncbi:MAG TPA: ATP-binding protein [Acidimicrobiales bacterium]|nr:ATP-binding protein [Acidimicrobiales bacterium]
MGSSLSFYEAQLPAELESVVAARRLLASSSAAWGLEECACNDGALAISELVTNSVLHAGTAVGIRICRLGAGMRIEVRDDDPRLPIVDAARPEDLLSNRSMTGRGLALVAAICDRWGCEPLGRGKVIWAEVGTGRRLVAAAPAPAFPTPAPPPVVSAEALSWGALTTSALTAGGRRVHLVGIPVELLLESARHMSDLQREMQVMSMDRTAPPEVEQVVQAGKPWVTDIDRWVNVDRRAAERALARGERTVDVEVVVPEDIARRIDGIAAWVCHTASVVLRRYLLTLPAPDEVVAYRRWYGEEIMAQIGGRPPRPCPVRLNRAARNRAGRR